MRLDLHQAAEALKLGRIVAIPTETFFGLAVDCHQNQAIEAIFQLKSRPHTAPLPLLVPSQQHVRALLSSPPDRLHLSFMQKFWPGKLTLILPHAKPSLSPLVRSRAHVAVRHDGHPELCALLNTTRLTLTGTSANLTGHPPLTRGQDVSNLFASHPLYAGHLSDATTIGGFASTILDLTKHPPEIAREGELSATLRCDFDIP